MVANYLRSQAFAGAERRLREGRRDDQGDIDGVPHTTIQIKYVAQPRLQTWVTDTLKQRDNAGNPFCLLVVRVRHQPVQCWDAYMPPMGGLMFPPEVLPEAEAWTWTRMDLRLAIVHLSDLIRIWAFSNSYSVSTGSTPTVDGIREWLSAPSMEKGTPPSPTT